MLSDTHLKINLILLGLLLAFSVCAHVPAQTQHGADSPSEDLGLEPSDEAQARQVLELLRAVLDTATPTEPQPEQTGTQSFLGDFESYLRTYRNTWHVILTKLALAGALGFILALVYRASYTGKRKKYDPSMMQSQLLLCVGGTLIWIIVGNYLVRAFGLAGMVGLIRYRTPVRDPKDNVMVFLSMLVGMACGLAQICVALIGTGFVCLLLLEMYHLRLGKKKKKKKKPQPQEPPQEAPHQP